MRRALHICLPLLGLLALPLGAVEPTSTPAAPVVLELFTSQGCSSCPPADRLLTELGRRDDVIALAFHVDYWNHLGWRDPFSSRAWSQRQEHYAETLFRGRSYTPQLVVNGRTHLVGSQRAEVEATIEQARAEPGGATVTLAWDADHKVATITTDLQASVRGGLELWVAVLENGLDTAVPRGENARRKLHNDFIVRSLERVANLSEEPGSAVHTYRPASRPTGESQLVALLQHPTSGHILAGAKAASQ